jgi:hypothetical protein
VLITFQTSVVPESGARYLIITHDDFYTDILPLAEWKHKKGMSTKVVKLSEIGSDSLSIKNYIASAYNIWETQPEYLLLVGAPNYMPFPIVDPWYSDNYYTNMIGDIYNEILSGRLTVHNTYETQTVVNKILAYERKPDRADLSWFKKACLIARLDYDDDDSIYWSDVHHAAALMANAGFIDIDTLSDAYGHDYDTVLNRINSGRSILMFRGQGLNNWLGPFNVNPDLAQNGTKLPIVLSITCRTIGTGSTPAVAERWFLTGTPTNPRGAAGYFATTTTGNNIAHLRSAVAKGFHDSLFLGSVKTFGAACEGGRVKAYTMYPFSGGADQYLGFTTIGDPEMNLWTDTPCSLIVVHPESIPVGEAGFTVNVSTANYSSPMNGAVVCIMGDQDSTIYVVDTTDASGNAYFQIYPVITNDTVHVTVTGRNLRPYEGFITITDSITGLEEVRDAALIISESLDIHPNPFRTILHIEFNGSALASGHEMIRIYDACGLMVREYPITGDRDVIKWTCDDLSGNQLSSGVYFVRVTPGDASKTYKVIFLR